MLGKLDRCMQKMQIDHQLTSYTRINLKWIKDLKVSHKTLKIPEENIGNKISDNSQSNIFTDMSPRGKGNRKRKKERSGTTSK